MPNALVTQKLRSTTPAVVFDIATTGALANNAAALSGTIAQEANGDQVAHFELVITAMGGTPIAGQPIDMFFVKTIDGATFEDGGVSGPTLPPNPAWTFGTRAAATLSQISPAIRLPSRDYKVLLRNASGQALSAASWGLRKLAASDQATW